MAKAPIDSQGEGFCVIGGIGANLRQVLFHSPWPAHPARDWREDQTLIAPISRIAQKLRAGQSSSLVDGLTDDWSQSPSLLTTARLMRRRLVG